MIVLEEKSDDDCDDICDDKEDLIVELVGTFQTVRTAKYLQASNLKDLFLQKMQDYFHGAKYNRH